MDNLRRCKRNTPPGCNRDIETTPGVGSYLTPGVGNPGVGNVVNILPHLAARDFDFPGIYLLGQSFEEIFERNMKNPRWGKTKELQRKEAELFFNCDRLKYKEEAEKYGFPVFSDFKEAEKEVLNLLA